MRSIMDFEFETAQMQNTHFHQNLEIIYILEGCARIEVEGERSLLNKSDYILINANRRHSVRSEEGELLTASFRIDFASLAEYLGTNRLLFRCSTVADKNEAYEKLRKVLDRILSRYYDRQNEGAIYLNSIYYEAVYLLVTHFMIRTDDIRLNGHTSPDDARVLEIQNYVQANYPSQISLSDLAGKLYLSNAYLSKYIKKRFGMSFLEYVNNIRLFHAVDDLVYTDKKITRIALENGFPTTAAFNKAFKDVYLMTPSAYRNSLNKGDGQYAEEEEKRKQVEKKVKAYLQRQTKVPEFSGEEETKLLEADAGKKEEYVRAWDGIINAGSVQVLLGSSMQEQILLLHREIGFRYVRLWNIFVKDMYEEKGGERHYNFSRLDRVLDFLTENGLKPYIELSFKPIHVSYSINVSLMNTDNDIIFNDSESYDEVMRDFAVHLTNRYGVREIETWYFELWKDERMNMLDENGRYFDCFESGYRALKRMSENIKVGGAGFALGYDHFHYRQLIRNWKKRQIRPDFISVYSYSYLLLYQDGVYFGKRSLDIDFVRNQTEIFRKMLREEEFEAPEFHITEWNFTISNRNCINDSCGQGAFVMKTCIDMIGKTDMMGFWYGSDLFSEYYDSEAVLCGDIGLLTKDSIKKPSFLAFHFLKSLQKYLLARSEDAVITTDGRGRYVIACHNCKQFSYRYNLKEEQEIQIADLEEIYEDLDPVRREFCIRGVENGDYIVRVFYVNRENGSVQDIWKDMEYMQNLSRGEIDYMRREASPKVEMKRLRVKDGVLRIATEMQPHEIKKLDISYQF